MIALLGLCVGSFLNVLINRIPNEEPILGRSYCPYCNKYLSSKDLVPVLSFVFLKGKCSSCKNRISWQYPLVEIATSLLFILTLHQAVAFGGVISVWKLLEVISLLIIAAILVVIFTTDLKYMIVPDVIIYPAMIIALVYQVIRWQMGETASLYLPILAGIGASLFFLLLVVITRGKGMGVGDIKIAAFAGFLLSSPNILVSLALSFFLGAVIGLILMAFTERGLKSEIPFGCFLAPSIFIALFWGEIIIEWYWKLII